MVKIDERALAHDALLAILAVAGFALFISVRSWVVGRKKNSASPPARSSRHKVAPLESMAPRSFEGDLQADPWLDVKQSGFLCNANVPHVVWRISLFAASLKENKAILRRAKGGRLFEFCSEPSRADKVISPIIRKVVSKYREKFDKQVSVVLSRKEQTAALLTWLASEAHIYNTIFAFLDECLILSKVSEVRPSLHLGWSNAFVVSVTWPWSPALLELGQTLENNPELTFEVDEESITLNLWIAFCEEKIPVGLRETTDLSPSERNKSSLKSA